MDEQLELFGEDLFPQPPPAARESRRVSEEPAPVPEEVCSAHPRAGRDGELTRIAALYCRGLGLPELAGCVAVDWNPRMRSAAGRAFFRKGAIELNPKLQSLPDGQREEEIRRTFLHELAHLVSHARAQGRRIEPHGFEWRQACADLGIPDEARCHQLDFGARRHARRYVYVCGHCETVVRRARRLTREVACYACCMAHSEGRYDPRFRLVERPFDSVARDEDER
jgi:SprT protein